MGNKEKEALSNTTVGQFKELSKAVNQLGVASTEDLYKAVQELGKAMNSVPPYTSEKRTDVSIFGIIKKAVALMALFSVLYILARLLF